MGRRSKFEQLPLSVQLEASLNPWHDAWDLEDDGDIDEPLGVQLAMSVDPWHPKWDEYDD